ncbi:hypothetical protein IW147_005500 [Coemansia sp. RSA 720]|nr:hypothetical protein IW147_005500 [Coemansia sp. RSA 720]
MQASSEQDDLGDCMDIDTNPVVSDIYVLHSLTSLYILVGLRDGRLVWSAADIRLFADMVDGTRNALPLFGDATFVEAGKVPVSDDTESTDCEAGRFLATFSTGGASVLDIEFQARCSICPYPVDSEPQRVVVDPDTGMLLVASIVRPQETTNGVAFLTSWLKVIDPDSGSIRAEVQFQPFELVCSLATWHIRGLKSYRYVCVGTTQFSEQPDGQNGLKQQAVGGRLVIYNLKPRRKPRKTQASPDAGQSTFVDPGFELKYVWESDRNGPVSALSSLGDSYLVVAVSTTILVLKLDVVQRQLIECCECSLRFAATSIDVCGTNIVVGSKREAVNLLRFTPAQSDGTSERLDLVHSARFGASTADARFLSSDLVAGVDHNGFLFVVGVPRDSIEFALDFVLGVHLGIPCSRLQVGRLVQRLDTCAHIVPWSEMPSDGSSRPQADCLVVGAVSGAVWTLAHISRDAFAMICCLEQAMMNMPPMHPARPLVTKNGTLNRARGRSTVKSVGVIDGAFSTMFVEHLTSAERVDVVRSSPELMQQALAIDGSGAFTLDSPDPGAQAATIIVRLISALNRASVC